MPGLPAVRPGKSLPEAAESFFRRPGPLLLHSVEPTVGESAAAAAGMGPEPYQQVPGHHAVLMLTECFLNRLCCFHHGCGTLAARGNVGLRGVTQPFGILAGLVEDPGPLRVVVLLTGFVDAAAQPAKVAANEPSANLPR